VGGWLKSLTLSQSNLESFITEIPPAALTQTFRDATEVARALVLIIYGLILVV
jgi:hypothetical protein